MANVSGTGVVLATTAANYGNLPNYAGMLWTASREQTPFLTMIGGLNGGKTTTNPEFPLNANYAHETPAQPSISEIASVSAPTALSYVLAQEKNTTQIFHEKIAVTYMKQANVGRLAGINTAGQVGASTNELDFQVARALTKMARDVEKTFLEGAYVAAGNSSVAHRSRGISTAANGASNEVDAVTAQLEKSHIDTLLKKMYAAGANFTQPVIFCGLHVKQRISGLYGYAPQDRNIGGVNIRQIETDVGNVGVMIHPYLTASTLLMVDVAMCSPVFGIVPGKGVLFYEELGKAGAATLGQIYGEIGLDYGAGALHGSIINLATA
jgi:hypothetical protein